MNIDLFLKWSDIPLKVSNQSQRWRTTGTCIITLSRELITRVCHVMTHIQLINYSHDDDELYICADDANENDDKQW